MGQAPLDAQLQTFSPATQPARPLPRWLLPPLVVPALLALPLVKQDALWNALQVVSVVAACGLAIWLEDRLFFALRRKSLAKRLIAALVLPVTGLIAGMALAKLAGAPFSWLGDSGLLETSLASGTLWFALAAVGSLLIAFIDTVVSLAVRGFRARVLLAVLGLVLITGGQAALIVFGLQSVVSSAIRSGSLQIGSGAQTRFELSARSDDGLEVSGRLGGEGEDETPIPGELAGEFSWMMMALLGLTAIPVVLSASGKLADAVMERVHPLRDGFRAVAAGRRDVRVEEAGSSEFVELGRSFNQMVAALDSAQRMERAFGRYVGGQLLERIRAQHGQASLPASQRVATVLFADIRGFTSMSERLEPQTVLDVLNRYFAEVVALIDAHQGFLNKFIGDAVVVVFNGPVDQADHAERAARCALAIQRKVAAMNASGAFPEIGTLQVGIGIATGPVVAGNLGSERQMEYTVIGDTVNLASRLTGQAPAGEVWVNEANARSLPADIARTALAVIKVKGREQGVVPYRVSLEAELGARAG